MNNLTNLQSIGNKIKVARHIAKWTQQQLADKAGLRLATVSELESGKTNFEINTLVRVAAALGFYLDINLVPAK